MFVPAQGSIHPPHLDATQNFGVLRSLGPSPPQDCWELSERYPFSKQLDPGAKHTRPSQDAGRRRTVHIQINVMKCPREATRPIEVGVGKFRYAQLLGFAHWLRANNHHKEVKLRQTASVQLSLPRWRPSIPAISLRPQVTVQQKVRIPHSTYVCPCLRVQSHLSQSTI